MLRFNRVTKNYNADQDALKDVSFEVESGELIVITGPSGSGKTTLLKLITKEQDPTEGDIYFKEESVSQLKKSKIPYHRRKIGAVFQDYKLLPELNIWENIALALSILGHRDQEIEEKVTDLLKLVGLTDKAYLFPHQLSGGEAQRISIARALSTAPELIFADEPTGNLDEKNSLTIAKLLKKINELGTTVIVTTHDPVVVKALEGARQMKLENGVLTDSKKPSKEKQAEVSVEKEEESETDDKKEKQITARKEEKKEETQAEEEKDNKQESVKAEKNKKSGFNFFGLFAKKKSRSTEDKEETITSTNSKEDEKEQPSPSTKEEQQENKDRKESTKESPTSTKKTKKDT